jgi:hypothetical protein
MMEGVREAVNLFDRIKNCCRGLGLRRLFAVKVGVRMKKALKSQGRSMPPLRI